jgi:peptidyl-dipeptidase Dcp
MRNALICIACVLALGCGGAAVDQPTTDANPFFSDYGTPFNVHPFDRISPEHFLPAFEEGMARQNAEVAAIVGNPEPPSFDNTIAALDRSGELLDEVSRVFFALAGSNTNDQIEDIQQQVSPMLAEHRDAIQLDPGLFERIKAVYDERDSLDLDREQRYLLEQLYAQYVRNGALLPEAEQARLKEINQRLSELRVRFNRNLLAETNEYKLVIGDSSQLAGLPPGVIATAAETAARDGLEGSWVFTTHKPSMLPFLTYSEDRDLRQQLYAAYTIRGNRGNEHDNKAVIAEIFNLRVEKARLLGYDTFADYQLEPRMAKNPDNVYALLNRLWDASLPVAKREVVEMQAIRDAGDHRRRGRWLPACAVGLVVLRREAA